MEACASAHHWARQFTAMGHRVRVINPQFVKPFVKGNKNVGNDAEAICEAMPSGWMQGQMCLTTLRVSKIVFAGTAISTS